MSKDDILQALRLTAMGRAGHPLQEELAEKLAALFAQPVVHVGMSAPAVAAAPASGEPVKVKKAK